MNWERKKKPAVMPLPQYFINEENIDEETGRKLIEAPLDIQLIPELLTVSHQSLDLTSRHHNMSESIEGIKSDKMA